MDDTSLHGRLRPGRLDGFGETSETIAADDQHVFCASVLQFGEHRQAELGALAFAITDPVPQNLFTALQVDANRQIRPAVCTIPSRILMFNEWPCRPDSGLCRWLALRFR